MFMFMITSVPLVPVLYLVRTLRGVHNGIGTY
jgi:hypothetical protein